MTLTNAAALKKRGYILKEGTLAAVLESEEFALKFIQSHAQSPVSIHFCPVSLKDSIQTRQRYLRRARIVKRPYEEVTGEGLLLKGIIKGPPHILEELRNLLIEEVEVPPEMLYLAEGSSILEGPAFLFAEKEVKQLIKMNELEAGIVETLPLDSRDICEYDPL